jgi:prepilin-type N-terminal cleavage/methylation domain-containing protein
MRFHNARAFTLIEILVVVVLLGILASVTTSMVSTSSNDARRVSADATARNVQGAIDMYRQYTGRLPDLIGANWTPLTQPTDINGKVVGPLLYGPPRNPAAQGDQSLVIDTPNEVYTTACAFAYDYQGGLGTGKFTAAKMPTP